MNSAFQSKVGSWISQNIGAERDFDGYYGAQCVDLVQFFNQEIVGATRLSGNAKDIWGQNPQSKYRLILNTPEFVPQAGDICVWGSSKGGGYGHIAVCTGSGNTSKFQSLDQNWFNPSPKKGSKAALVVHDYDGVIGFMRPVASEVASAPVEVPIPIPSVDNQVVVNGQNLRAHTQPNTTSSWPWYFDDKETVVIFSRRKGENITSGPYAPSDWWYEVRPQGTALWISDAFVLSKATPAAVPDYMPPLEVGTSPISDISVRPATGLFGIDVSSHNGVIDWAQLKPMIDFAIIRAGHVGASYGGISNNGDPKYASHKAAARASGIVLGSYWYGFPSLDAKAEAASFAAIVGSFTPGESIFLDMETAGANVVAWTRTFMNEVERITSRTCHLYTGFSFYNDNGLSAVLTGKRKLWVAHYSVVAGTPVITEAVMHQYSSSGKLLGVSSSLDLNIFYGQREGFLALGDQLIKTEEPPMVDPTPVPGPVADPTPKPKVIAATLGAAATTIILWLLSFAQPIGEIPVLVSGAITTIVTFAAGYLTSDR